MGNLIVAEVQVEGTRPLMWHWFGPDAIPLERQERTGVAGNDPEEWRRTHLANKDRQLYLLPSYVFGTVVAGAVHTKKGRSSIQKDVSATLQVVDNLILVDRFLPEEPIPTTPDNPVYIDVRMVRNPSTGARNVRYRVTANAGWTCKFSLLWDKTIVSREQMEAAVRDAGRYSGLGNGRSIGMGRFHVMEMHVKQYVD